MYIYLGSLGIDGLGPPREVLGRLSGWWEDLSYIVSNRGANLVRGIDVNDWVNCHG